MVVLFGVAACAGLFGIVGLRVLLAQGQVPLDQLEAKVATAQAEHQRLRLELAGLESPARIVGEAKRRLGMSPPAVVIYLPPVPLGPATGAQSVSEPAHFAAAIPVAR